MHGYTSGLKKIISLILVISMVMSLSLNCITITYSDEIESDIDSFKSQCENAVQNIKDYTKLKAESEKLTAQYDSFSDTDKQDEYARIALNKVQDTVSDLALAEMNNKFNSLKDRYNQGKYNIKNMNDFESAAKEVTDIQQDIQVKHEDQIKQVNIEIETMRSNITTKIVVEEDTGNNSGNTSDIGEVAPYDVKFTWADVGDNCVLSEDGTHAVWTDTLIANDSIATKLRLEITFNREIGKQDSFFIDIPKKLMEFDIKDITNNIIDEPILKNNTVHAYGKVNNNTLINILSQIESNLFRLVSYNDSFRILINNDVPAGTKVSIPLSVDYFIDDYYAAMNTILVHLPKGDKVYGQISDNLNRIYQIGYEIHDRSDFNLNISKWESLSASPITYNKLGRVWSWNPYMKQAYGIDEQAFNTDIDAGYGYFEFRFKIDATGYLPAGLKFNIDPSNNGNVIGSYITVNPSTQPGTAMIEDNNKYWRFENTNLGNTLYTPSINTEEILNDYSGRRTYLMLSKLFSSIRNGRLGNATNVYGVGLGTLIKYKLQDIYNEAGNYTECNCTLNVDIISIFSDEQVNKSFSITNTQPYTQMDSSGKVYRIQSAYSYFNYSECLLPLFKLGFDKLGGHHFKTNGYYRMPNGYNETSANLCFDIVDIYDSFNKKHIILGPEEYELSDKISLSISPGTEYTNENGDTISTKINEDRLDDIINVYVTTWESPDDWLLVKQTKIKDIVSGHNFSLDTDHIIGIRVEYPNRTTFIHICIEAEILLYNNGSIRDLVDKYYGESSKYTAPQFYQYSGLVDIANGKSLVGGTNLTQDIRDIINNRSEVLYKFVDMDNGFPLRSFYKRTYTAKHLVNSYGIAALSRKADGKETTINVNLTNVSEIDYWFGAMISAANLPITSSNISNINDDSPLLYNRARFFIKIPKNSELIDVIPSITSDTFFHSDDKPSRALSYKSFKTHNEPAYGSKLIFYIDDVKPIISYELMENEQNETILIVDTTLDYDHKDKELISKFRGVLFGDFTIRIRPKYSDVYMSSNDTKIEVSAYIIDNHGNIYDGDRLLDLRDGHLFSDTQESVHIMKASCSINISDGTYVSGLNLAAKGLKDRLWSRNATIKPGDEYQYRIRYSQMSEKSKDVILFDSVEDLSPASQSYITSLNLDDAIRQGISYRVYGNKQQINSNEYVNNNANRSILTTDNGWFEITDVANLKDSEVKSIAVDFGDTQFENGVDGKPFSVDVIVNMQSASDGYNYGDNIVKNKAFFSDLLLASNKSRSAQTSEVTVNINTEADYELLKQIVGPNEQETNNKRSYTINEENEEYTYRLTYTLKDGQTSNVIIHDNIEESIKSRYAGTITGIDCTGCGEVPGVIYVAGKGIDGDSNLPIGFEKVVGNWKKVDGTFADWEKVEQVAVYFGDHTFKSGDSVYIDINMKTILNEKNKGSFFNKDANIRQILNDAGIIYKTYDIDELQEGKSNNTTLDVQCPEPPLIAFLPKTGGQGVYLIYTVGLLAIASSIVIIKKKKDNSIT